MYADVHTVFAEMLNEMRLGRISDETVKTFKSLSRPLEFEDGLEFTELSVPWHVSLVAGLTTLQVPYEIRGREFQPKKTERASW